MSGCGAAARMPAGDTQRAKIDRVYLSREDILTLIAGKKNKYIDFQLNVLVIYPFVICCISPTGAVFRGFQDVDRSKVSMFMVRFDRPRILLLRSDSPTAASKGQSKWTQAGAQSHMLVGGSPCSSTPSAPFITKIQYEIIYIFLNTLSSVSFNSGHSIN